MSILHPKRIPQKHWWWARWVYWFVLGFAVLFAILLIIGLEREHSRTMVPVILAKHITIDDVLGTNLPPEPDAKLVNKTLAGVDANENGIRDDVELAIFKNHPDDIVLRAAQLQYAFALQMYFTDVFSGETLGAVGEQVARGSVCIRSAVPVPWGSRDEITQELATPRNLEIQSYKDELYDLFYNNDKRREGVDKLYNKFTYVDVSKSGENCDLNPGLVRTYVE